MTVVYMQTQLGPTELRLRCDSAVKTVTLLSGPEAIVNGVRHLKFD